VSWTTWRRTKGSSRKKSRKQIREPTLSKFQSEASSALTPAKSP